MEFVYNRIQFVCDSYTSRIEFVYESYTIRITIPYTIRIRIKLIANSYTNRIGIRIQFVWEIRIQFVS